jgi:hypothetical protein
MNREAMVLETEATDQRVHFTAKEMDRIGL